MDGLAVESDAGCNPEESDDDSDTEAVFHLVVDPLRLPFRVSCATHCQADFRLAI